MVVAEQNSADPVVAVEQNSQSRARLVVFLLGLAILHGSIINLMPLMFSSMAATFHVDKAQQGMLKSCFFAGLMVSLVASGYLTRYLGARRMTILAGIVAGAGAVFFGLAPTYALVLAAASVMAMGIAPMTAVYAAVIVADFPHVRRRMYLWVYGLLAGSGALAQTALGSLLDIVPRYNPIFIVLGVLIWSWMTMLLVVGWRPLGRTTGSARFDRRKDVGKTTLHEKLASLWRFLGSGVFSRGALYMLGLLAIFDYLFASNMLAWTPSFFEELYHGGSVMGGMALSASSAGVCVGRLVMGSLPLGKIPARIWLAACYAGSVFSFGAIIFLHPAYMSSIGLMFLSGAFLSAHTPTLGSLAVEKFGDRAPVVIPLYEGFGAVGGLVGPPLLGLLATHAGKLDAVMWLVPAVGLGLSTIAIGWEFFDRRRGIPELCSIPVTELSEP
jgi:MFS family permease